MKDRDPEKQQGFWCQKCGIRYPNKAFTLIELMIVVAIIALLMSIAIPNCMRAKHIAEQKAGIVQQAQLANEGGGNSMFRFIELLLLVAILYIIANLLHYIFVRTTGVQEDNRFWLFGMSDGWLKKDAAKKKQQEPPEEDTQPRRRTTR
jgi:prepilin-type N-terminal cleavage/methylation domain-containing protein